MSQAAGHAAVPMLRKDGGLDPPEHVLRYRLVPYRTVPTVGTLSEQAAPALPHRPSGALIRRAASGLEACAYDGMLLMRWHRKGAA